MFLVNTLQSWTLCNCICRRVDPKQYVVLVLGEGVSKICLNIVYSEMGDISRNEWDIDLSVCFENSGI